MFNKIILYYFYIGKIFNLINIFFLIFLNNFIFRINNVNFNKSINSKIRMEDDNLILLFFKYFTL